MSSTMNDYTSGFMTEEQKQTRALERIARALEALLPPKTSSVRQVPLDAFTRVETGIIERH